VKFLIDAQLPRRLAHRLTEAGHDALHTLDLPAGNRTSDHEIARLADEQHRVVVTKDADFVHSHQLTGCPRRLLLISTGNIRNVELERLLQVHLGSLVAALGRDSFLELTRTAIVVRG
jgi:predicted nuclease of predicted toxin-antitoxin system